MSSLFLDVFYRDHGAQKGMVSLGKSTADTAQHFDKLKVASTVGLLAAGAAIVKFGTSSVKAYSDASESQKQLAFAFSKFPALTDTNQAALQKLNSALQLKTKYDDDEIASGQAVLAQFKLTGKQLTEITPLLLDYADKTGKDIPAAAQDVGKALLGNAKALKNIGIRYTATGNSAKDFTNISALMRQQIGGFAETEGKTAAGQLAILKNQFGELEEAVGSRLLPVLSSGTHTLTDLVVALGDNADVIIPLVGTVGGLAAAIWLAQKAQLAFKVTTELNSGIASAAVKGLGALKMAFTGVELSSEAAARGMRVAQLSIPLVGVALFAVTSVMAHFATKSQDASQQANDFATAMQSVEGNVTRATAALNEQVRAKAVDTLQSKGAYEQAKLLGISYSDVTDAALGNKDAIGRVNEALTKGLAVNQQSSKANADLHNAAVGLSQSMGGVAHATLDAVEAERIRRGAMKQSAPATVTMADLQERLKGKTHDLNTEIRKVVNTLTILKHGALDQQSADLAWEDALDGLTASVKQNGRSLSEHTQKGRDNRRAIIAAMQALDEKTQADYKNAASAKNADKATAEANKRYRDNKRDLEKAAIAAGYSKGEVRKMIAQYLKTPKQLRTDVSTPGVKKARGDIRGLRGDITDLRNKKVNIEFSTNAYKIGKTKFAVNLTAPSSVGRSATGGLIRGPGSGTSDSILGVDRSSGAATSWVSNGEFVVNQKQTAKHLPLLKAINSGVEGYAGGGVVRNVAVETGPFPKAASQLPGVFSWFTSAFAKGAGKVLGNALAAGLKKTPGFGGAGGLGDPANVSNPRGVTSYHGARFTRLFVANLKAAERDAGRPFAIYQGGFRPSTSYSGSTHNMDAIDAHVNYALLRAFRRHVGAMGDRTGLGNWASHMHGVPAPGHGFGSPSARAQYRDYLRRGGSRQSPRSPWGLSGGGVMLDPSTINVSERGPERVLTTQQNVGFERLVQAAVTAMGGSNAHPRTLQIEGDLVMKDGRAYITGIAVDAIKADKRREAVAR